MTEFLSSTFAIFIGSFFGSFTFLVFRIIRRKYLESKQQKKSNEIKPFRDTLSGFSDAYAWIDIADADKLHFLSNFYPAYSYEYKISANEYGTLSLKKFNMRIFIKVEQQKQGNIMLNDLIKMFKENPYTEISNLAQVMAHILTTFAQDKFVNGETGRDAAIDALCQLLQSHKSTAPK